MLAPQTSALLLLASALVGQSPPTDVDPYTRGDTTAMARAGVVALQRFAWTNDHTTLDIQRLMGFEPFRFVETAHFKIASSLAPMPVPKEQTGRDRIRNELTELAKTVVNVDPRAKALDSWLRTHLYAQRLERLYAEFAHRFGVREAALARSRPGSAFDAAYVGEGPYLGQRGKYLVVLARDSASVGTYARNFLDRAPPRTFTRHHLPASGSILVLGAEDLADDRLRDDATLHAAVIYHVAHALLDGYRHYWHDCPFWFEEGIAHWFQREAEPDRACFSQRPTEQPEQPGAVDWRTKVRARLAHGNVVPSAELFRASDNSARFEDHLAAWSRVDFLLTAHGDGFAMVARQIKGPDETAIPPVPSPATIAARSATALKKVFGWSPEQFDAQWSAWALKTYPKL